MRPLLRLAPTLAFALFLIGAGGLLEPERLDQLSRASPGASLPSGWEVRSVDGSPPVRSVVEGRDGAHPWMRFGADGGEATQFWIELDEPLDPDSGRLGWRWRVDVPIREARLRDPERDDSSARLFVVFGEPGMMSPPRTIFYSWGGVPAGGNTAFFRSHVSERLAVLEIRGAGDSTGVWLREERSPGADFREAFSREPPEIRAVGFMMDTDQTGAPARAGLDWIRWVAEGKEGS